jgi:hypothetical protein
MTCCPMSDSWRPRRHMAFASPLDVSSSRPVNNPFNSRMGQLRFEALETEGASTHRLLKVVCRKHEIGNASIADGDGAR